MKEIGTCIKSGENIQKKILDKVSLEKITKEEAGSIFDSFRTEPVAGEVIKEGESVIIGKHGRDKIDRNHFISCLTDLRFNYGQETGYYRFYAHRYFLELDGPSRIGLIEPQQGGDLKNPVGSFAKLFTDDEKRESFRNLIYNAIGFYPALDATDSGKLHIRYSKNPPFNERSLSDANIEYMRDALSIGEVSDGVKAFTGILLQLHIGEPKVITIDEPEAFLHPSLAFSLGKEIASGAIKQHKHIFVSTHSARFLMGAISSGAKVNIVRLTYDGENGTARLLKNDDLIKMMRDPLLRSVGVIEGLFYNYVVVGEANADRAFYNEVNDRLIAKADNRGVLHTLFLNADNKQTIPRIISPLRKLGIPTAGIVDIDFFKEGGEEHTRHLSAIGIPEQEHSSYADRRGKILKTLEGDGSRNFKREGGVELLNGPTKEAAENFLRDLAEYGLFVVPCGEIEKWLGDIDIPRAKKSWLHSIFEAMGSDPDCKDYVQPSEGDVWDFMGEISAWLQNAKRKGIPT